MSILVGVGLLCWFVIGYEWPWEAQVLAIRAPRTRIYVFLPLVAGVLLVWYGLLVRNVGE